MRKHITMFSFSVSSAVRGEATSRRKLHYQYKVANSHNPFSVAIFKQIHGKDTNIGYILWRISILYNTFNWQGGTIQYTVVESRRYSADLP